MENKNIEFILPNGWVVEALVDDDGHLDIQIDNTEHSDIDAIDADVRSRHSIGVRLRFTTPKIEDKNPERLNLDE